ncbi:MAG: FAD-dependent oxidoreductase [Pseudomonadales bacterium]|jgi:glycine/D-amino acid oxidase-like deaminating enzyme|nr:FAD-dependent oxidoreductase [Pseudomonadales bacterium]
MPRIDRRTFLSTGLAAVAGTLAPRGAKARSEGTAPAVDRALPDVVVIGAGVFGTWTALNLCERGARVTLLDAYGPGNARQTSSDETRQIRAAYGEDEIYSRWAQRAFTLWHTRQEEFQRRIIYANGVLSTNDPADKLAIETTTFEKLEIPFEMLGPDELRYRWPQARWDDVDHALYEPQGGTVKARESIIAAAELFERKGGQVRIGHAVPGRRSGGRLESIALADGTELKAGKFVFACGPWLPDLLPDILGGYINRRRSEVFYVGSRPGDDRFHWARFPNMWEPRTGAYAMSDVDYGYKVVPRLGVPIDPDMDDRMPSPFLMRSVEDYLRMRAPALLGQPIVATRVCTLENSNNHHYIIDTHPDYDNVWLAGAGSGHGFKMGPVLGEYIADRVLDVPDDPDIRRLFALASHRPV